MSDNDVMSRSPLSRLSKREYERHTTLKRYTYTVTATPVRVAQENPNRVSLMIHNPNVLDVKVSNSASMGIGEGLLLSGNGGTIIFTYDEDGESVGYEFFAVLTTTTTVIEVWEVTVI